MRLLVELCGVDGRDSLADEPIENPKASQYTLAMQRIVPLGLPSLAQ
jgi:hypothetical protein